MHNPFSRTCWLVTTLPDLQQCGSLHCSDAVLPVPAQPSPNPGSIGTGSTLRDTQFCLPCPDMPSTRPDQRGDFSSLQLKCKRLPLRKWLGLALNLIYGWVEVTFLSIIGCAQKGLILLGVWANLFLIKQLFMIDSSPDFLSLLLSGRLIGSHGIHF